MLLASSNLPHLIKKIKNEMNNIPSIGSSNRPTKGAKLMGTASNISNQTFKAKTANVENATNAIKIKGHNTRSKASTTNTNTTVNTTNECLCISSPTMLNQILSWALRVQTGIPIRRGSVHKNALIEYL